MILQFSSPIKYIKPVSLILLCGLFILSSVSGVSISHANFPKIYNDDILGISFSFPDGWEVRSEGSRIDSRNISIEHIPDQVLSDKTDSIQSKYLKIEIGLVQFSRPSEIELENWVEPLTDKEELITQTSRQVGEYSTLERQVIPFGDSLQLGNSIYVANSNKTLLINAYGADPDIFRPILDRIIISLKFRDILDSVNLPSTTQLGKINMSVNQTQANTLVELSDNLSMPLGARHTFDIFPIPNPRTNVCQTLGCYWISQGPNGDYTHQDTVSKWGIDFITDTGTRVYASRAGTIIKVGKQPQGSGYFGFGNIVLIQHSDGTTTLYAHLSDWENLLDTYVEKGAWIGLTGSSGWQDAGLTKAWAPHLHFQARNGISSYDPPIAVDNIEGIFWNSSDPYSESATGYAYGPPVLYSEAGFTGNSQAFPESVSNLLDQELLGGVGNDRASSSDWQYPWTFMMYAHGNAGLPGFRGQGDIANFGDYTFGNGVPLNDNVTSITVAMNSCPLPGIGPLSTSSDEINVQGAQESATINCQPVPAAPPIDSVMLLSPGDGQTISSQPVHFNWSIAPISGLDGYQLLVKTNSNMDSGGSILLNAFTSDTAYAYTFASYNGTAYWSVRPKVNGNYGPWSYVNGHTSSLGFGTSVSTPTPQPPPPASGWNETFYRDNILQSSCGSRNETDVYMFRDSDGGWSPPAGCPSYDNAWSVRMERTDAYFQGGNYNFGLFYDDGARLYIDDVLRVDGWIGTQHYEGVYLSAGNHRLRLEYKNNAGHAIVQLWWQGPGALPGYNQTQDPQQWWANYWGNPGKWQDSVGRQNEGTGFLDHDWGYNSPGFGLPQDKFSTSFERTIYFYCGDYQFHLKSDDGSRFSIDGSVVPEFDNWSPNVWDITETIHLETGNHLLKVDHFENDGAAHIYLDWTTTSQCPVPHPQPAITSVSPQSVTAGTGALFLNISGSNFVPGTIIFWNAQSVDTQYLNASNLSAVIPSSFFTAQGTASLYVVNPSPGGGNSNTINFTIYPAPPKPSASFDAWPQSGNAPLTSAMHIVSMSNITSCLWNYGDGQTSTTCSQLHDHIYNNSGSYTVSLIVNGPGGSDSMTRTNYITASANGDSYEPDNESAQAKVISSGLPQTHSILPTTDIDWVKFTLTQTAGIHLETSGATSSDTRMWLFDSNLTEIEPDDDDGAGNYSLIDRTCEVNSLPPGTYYVKVDAYNNDSEISSYTLLYSITQNCTPTPSPVPSLTNITPKGVLNKSSNFKMTILGTNFVTNSVVKWGTNNLATTYVSSTKLTAEVPAGNLMSAAIVDITVFNPTPGGGISNPMPFVIYPPNEWFSNGPEGKYIGELVITPSNILYVGTGSSGVYKSIDGAANWIQINTGLTNLRIQSMALDAVDPSIIYVGTEGGGVFKTIDGGGNWVAANTGLTDLYVYSLAVDPTIHTIVYGGTANDKKIFKSTNGGSSWSVVNSGPFANEIAIDPISTSTIYVGSLFNGVYKTTNGGTNWTTSNVGLGLDEKSIYSLAIDPITHTTLYAGKWGNGVYKSMNSGVSWNTANSGYESENIWALVIDPVNPAILYAGTGSEIIRSSDGGTTWSKVSSNLGIIHSLALKPGNPNILYAGTSNGVFTIQFLAPGDKKVYLPIVIR